jgi:hypothetical protein
MRLESLSVALRLRDPWEAFDLGTALWRRHWAAIMRPWLALATPVFVALAALGWSLDAFWLAALLSWWIQPLLDRVPLYVLSRAVFGSVPATREVLRARELYSPGLWSWLSWRRLHPARALLLPVDVLEGATGARRAQRAAVLQRAVSAPAIGLWVAGLCFQLVVLASLLLLGLMFVPTEFLSESARAVFATVFDSPPPWARLLALAGCWLALALMQPLTNAAGFGLYLNRRTQLEAWDVELVFRRLAARVRAANAMAASLLVLAVAMAASGWSAPARAADKAPPPSTTPAQLVGAQTAPVDPRFQRALDRAYADPLLARTQAQTHWELRQKLDRQRDDDRDVPAWLKSLGSALGWIGEHILWLLAALLVALLLWRLPRWLPWVQRQMRAQAPLPPIKSEALPAMAPLPPDIAAAATALWQAGQFREALALLYRASVLRLSARLDLPFPPGATEAECLRRSRRLEDLEARASFQAVLQTWQRAAYAHQFPDRAAFEALLGEWSRRFPEAA